MRKKKKPSEIIVPEDLLVQWQGIVDTIAELAGIPAGLIMRIKEEDIEVLVASKTKENPYHPGDREYLAGSGLYCETVINTKCPLLVPNALSDPKWKNNPDVKLNMISYLGFPILFPDESPFGTLCVLDNNTNSYNDSIYKLLENFRQLIQQHLALLYMNSVLGEENKSLIEYLKELQSLRGLIPICSKCKKIRDSKGHWRSVEEYLIHHPKADFSHGYCPECFKKIMDSSKNSCEG